MKGNVTRVTDVCYRSTVTIQTHVLILTTFSVRNLDGVQDTRIEVILMTLEEIRLYLQIQQVNVHKLTVIHTTIYT